MEDNRREAIEFNETLVRRMVYAINKAITEDVPQELRLHHLETNNRCRFAPGDYINENLRRHVVNEGVDLIPFQRFVYEGRILVDRKNKVTYTIVTFATLATGARKHGTSPYYLQSILSVENGDCEGTPKQMTLGDYAEAMGFSTFSQEEYEADFDTIMQGAIGKDDGYRHYIIGYSAKRSEIQAIELLYLDSDFAEVDSRDLMEYIVPDFAMLTEVNYENESVQAEEETQQHKLFKLRPGVKPALRAKEEEVL